MPNNLFDKKYLGNSAYSHGWSVALSNFRELQSEDEKKSKKWKHRLRDWWKGIN